MRHVAQQEPHTICSQIIQRREATRANGLSSRESAPFSCRLSNAHMRGRQAGPRITDAIDQQVSPASLMVIPWGTHELSRLRVARVLATGLQVADRGL
jgi:hypothetical protein